MNARTSGWRKQANAQAGRFEASCWRALRRQAGGESGRIRGQVVSSFFVDAVLFVGKRVEKAGECAGRSFRDLLLMRFCL